MRKRLSLAIKGRCFNHFNLLFLLLILPHLWTQLMMKHCLFVCFCLFCHHFATETITWIISLLRCLLAAYSTFQYLYPNLSSMKERNKYNNRSRYWNAMFQSSNQRKQQQNVIICKTKSTGVCMTQQWIRNSQMQDDCSEANYLPQTRNWLFNMFAKRTGRKKKKWKTHKDRKK